MSPRALLAAGLLALGLSPAASAADLPSISSSSSSDGVTMRMLVQAPIDEVRSVLSRAETSVTLSPDVMELHTTDQGNCERVEVSTRGLFSPMRYVGLRCPTSEGWSETLVESEDFTHYDVEWTLSPTDEGTMVTYRIDVSLKNLPVPDRVLHSNLSSSMKHVMASLAERVTD